MYKRLQTNHLVKMVFGICDQIVVDLKPEFKNKRARIVNQHTIHNLRPDIKVLKHVLPLFAEY